MSEFQNVSIASLVTREMNEEFFDLHPRPYDITYCEIGQTIKDKITLYLDPNNPETFLLKIRFSNWIECDKTMKWMQVLFEHSDIDVYRSTKYLFLRRLLF